MPDTQTPAVDHNQMANAIRALSMDAVERANSGHPGMPMGMADVATVLFTKFLRYDPDWPDWPDRDRFVLSAGHGSMLLYSLLYLTGYAKPTLEDIQNFRQLDCCTAGHPEYGEAGGIETTTGPLGQGFAMAVGMALAERLEAARNPEITDHRTFVIAGDGDLMEGVSHEAASLAGHLNLSKLCVLYDDNGISIDGPTSLAFSDDSLKRFEAYGWFTSEVDGHDADAVEQAIAEAVAADKPALIACKTVIGYGAPQKQGTAGSHGAPLGVDEIAAARERLGWSHAPFEIPDAVMDTWRKAGARGRGYSHAWRERFDAMASGIRKEIERRWAGEIPGTVKNAVRAHKKALAEEPVNVATRKASQMALEVINRELPDMIGGSADLSGSNNTKAGKMDVVRREDFAGRYIHYGVREFAMAAAMNGMALHRGFIPYGGTFLVFTDYCRPAIRLSAIMKKRVIYVMTHDSIGLGEDGPTHQPIEHLASLRAMPNLLVFRPADAVETAEAWEAALRYPDTPSVIALSRQGLAQVRLAHEETNLAYKGGYVLREASTGVPRVILIATGSEVSLAVAAREMLENAEIPTRVVSMVCQELFDIQPMVYQDDVLGSGLGAVERVAIEAAAGYGWERYAGRDGLIVGMTGFGASGPAKDLFRHFGFTAEAIVEAVKDRL